MMEDFNPQVGEEYLSSGNKYFKYRILNKFENTIEILSISLDTEKFKGNYSHFYNIEKIKNGPTIWSLITPIVFNKKPEEWL